MNHRLLWVCTLLAAFCFVLVGSREFVIPYFLVLIGSRPSSDLRYAVGAAFLAVALATLTVTAFNSRHAQLSFRLGSLFLIFSASSGFLFYPERLLTAISCVPLLSVSAIGSFSTSRAWCQHSIAWLGTSVTVAPK